MNLTLIFIAHDLAIVRNLCDRVVVMYRGEIVEEGLSDEVFARPKHPYTAALIAAIPDIDPDKPLLRRHRRRTSIHDAATQSNACHNNKGNEHHDQQVEDNRTCAIVAGLTLSASFAEAAGVLTIGRREDSTTFDPIKTAQNIDNWVFSNVYDVLVRVDKTGTKLEPGLAESWTVSDDGLTYTFKIRDAKFSDGSPLTAEDAAYSLLRIRDDKASLWSDCYKVDRHGRRHRCPHADGQAQEPVGTVPVDAGAAERLGHLEEGHGSARLGRLHRKADRLGRLRRRRMASRRPRHPEEEPVSSGRPTGSSSTASNGYRYPTTTPAC